MRHRWREYSPAIAREKSAEPGRGKPPWWPEGEPWPPRGPAYRWHRGRARFMRRAGLVFGAVFILGLIGLSTVVSWIARPGLLSGAWVVALLAAFGIVLFTTVARRLVPLLGDIVAAAGRIAEGDFDVRVAAYGPPSLRNVGAAFNKMAERLARQERSRCELMADVAHELRTPLSVVQGRLEGLIDGVYPADAAHLEPLLDQTRMLGRLVEDLRTLANAESGVLALEREPTDIGMLMRDAVEAVSDEATRRRVVVHVDEPEEALVVELDPLRIRQVLVNLLANAIAHAGGGASVTAAARGTADSLIVSVRDTGSGIAPEELPKIFDRFYKRHGSRGSGLGLTIARDLVRAHGGTITAESRAGEGTTVTFSLPRRSA
jgi:signal transduction histidine kinase